MSISVHTGYPGSGKSHALVKDVIVPAVLNGRRVLTNVDGINPDAVHGYCAERVTDGDKLGSVTVFDGNDALQPGFFPTEAISDAGTVVKGGDLVVFDEWRLYFNSRAKGWAPDDLVKFMRWHRHLTHEKGYSTDIHIATQLATDLHPDIRGLCERSYKYAKLRATGMANQYSWKVWQGHLQPKGQHYLNGVGTYDSEIFPLYSSSSAAGGSHVELSTNKRDSIWQQPKTWAVLAAAPVLLIAGLWQLTAVYARPVAANAPVGVVGPQGVAVSPSPTSASLPPPGRSPWRIVGVVDNDVTRLVVVQDGDGALRSVSAEGFEFRNGEPVSGLVDGLKATPRDEVPVMASAASGLGL